MKIAHVIPPLAALVIAGGFLLSQHITVEKTRRTVGAYEEVIQRIAERQGNKKAASDERPTSGTEEDGDQRNGGGEIDPRELIDSVTSMLRENTRDYQGFLKLQKRLSELSPEQTKELISRIDAMEPPADVRDQILPLLLDLLAARDPKSSVLMAVDSMMRKGTSREGGWMNRISVALGAWVKREPLEALRWYDAEREAGTFEGKSLKRNNRRGLYEGAILEALAERDPALARERLASIPEAERLSVFQNAKGLMGNSEKRQLFATLARETLSPEQQANALESVIPVILGGDELERVSGFLRDINATTEEKNIVVAGATEMVLKNLSTAPADNGSPGRRAALWDWLAEQDSERADVWLGKSLASLSQNPGAQERFIALLNEFHATRPSDDLIEAYLEHARVALDALRLEEVAKKIQDPTRRAAALKKLGK